MRAIWTVDRGSWSPVHWPRQDGSISPGQVLCSEMENFLLCDAATCPMPCHDLSDQNWRHSDQAEY